MLSGNYQETHISVSITTPCGTRPRPPFQGLSSAAAEPVWPSGPSQSRSACAEWRALTFESQVSYEKDIDALGSFIPWPHKYRTRAHRQSQQRPLSEQVLTGAQSPELGELRSHQASSERVAGTVSAGHNNSCCPILSAPSRR